MLEKEIFALLCSFFLSFSFCLGCSWDITVTGPLVKTPAVLFFHIYFFHSSPYILCKYELLVIEPKKPLGESSFPPGIG